MASRKERSGGEHIKIIILKHKIRKYKNYRFPMLIRWAWLLIFHKRCCKLGASYFQNCVEKRREGRGGEGQGGEGREERKEKDGWNKKKRNCHENIYTFWMKTCISRNFTEWIKILYGIMTTSSFISCAQRKSTNAQQQRTDQTLPGPWQDTNVNIRTKQYCHGSPGY